MTNDPRYPLGKFSFEGNMTEQQKARCLDDIEQTPARLRAAVSGLNDQQLDTPYRDAGWTVRQVVHHVADSHMNSYVRFKLALTEDWPTIKTYEEGAWAKLPDSAMPVEVSLALIDALHRRWVSLLELMSEEDFQRGFEHPEMGRQNLARTLGLYDWHSRHHTAHITGLRERQGW
jgi:uncharacterized damage-inducible protein DinB